ncbi:MAG: HD-GYP domain-containing protein [Calditrichota bacterium]
MPWRRGTRYLLYKAADTELSAQKRRELMENGVTTLYVRDDDAGVYYEFVDRTVGQVVASEKISMEEKSKVLYQTSQALVKSTFERPQSPMLIATNEKIVTHTVSMLVAEPTVLRTMVSLFAFDYSLYTHSVHVSVLATGLLLDLDKRPADNLRDLAMGFLLHDIGKSRVPSDILRKPGMLTPWEIRQMEKHPEHGSSLMQHHEKIHPRALEIIHDHHELLDGSGYPRHLSRDSLSLETRICSVADVFDALTSHRVYKPAMRAYDAIQSMLTRMKGKLDQEIVQHLIHQLGPNATRAV